MGANEARHVLAMVDDLGKVLALELMTAAQALDLRARMVEGEAHPAAPWCGGAHAAIRERIRSRPRPRARRRRARRAGPVDDGTVLAAVRAATP